jgi:hypothetical protein
MYSLYCSYQEFSTILYIQVIKRYGGLQVYANSTSFLLVWQGIVDV